MSKTVNIDIRGVTVLRDHNTAMVFRIRYITQVLNRNFESLKLYEKLKSDCDRMVMLYIKYYSITEDDKILSRIIETLYSLAKCERKAVNLLLNELCFVKNKCQCTVEKKSDI